MQIIVLLTVLSLAPAILIMMTSFTRIIIVLSLLRQAMGTQQLAAEPGADRAVAVHDVSGDGADMDEGERQRPAAVSQRHVWIKKPRWLDAQVPLRDFMIKQITESRE